jgi:putative ABC transport system permease protein
MGIPLVAGRFVESWDGPDSGRTVVISRSMAARFWPGGNALGERIKLAAPREEADWLEVVGVVGDVRQAWFGPGLDAVVYVPLAQAPVPSATLVVRSGSADTTLEPTLRRVVREVDRDVQVGEIVSMERVVEESFWKNRLYAIVFSLCAAVTVVLAASGVFALASYAVALRAREWSIRLALGASPRDILRAAAAQGMAPAVIGAAVGVAAAYPACAAARSLLFGISPWDPIAFAVAPLALATAALAACFVPATRAAAADPAAALRC